MFHVERDKIHTLETCPVCNHSDFELFLNTKDYFLSGENFQIQCCKNCSFKFTNPRPLESELQKYYESPEYISHAVESRNIFEKIYTVVRSITIYTKFRLVKKFFRTGVILDIGSGTGEFLNYLNKKGISSKGIEAIEKAREFSKVQYGLEVLSPQNYNSIPDQSFHVITMWHVLEHIFDLEKQIKEMKRILVNNGILIIAVPNLNSYDSRYYNKYWAAFDLPRHLYHFEQYSIKQLFENHQFELIKIKPMYFDSFYVSLLSEKYKTGKRKIVRPFFIGLISNLLAGIRKKNYSSLVYVFKLK